MIPLTIKGGLDYAQKTLPDMMSSQTQPETTRDFFVRTAESMTVVGVACTARPLIESMNPAADTLAADITESNISSVQLGQNLKVKWRGAPVFVRHRMPEDTADADKVNVNNLRDPQTDEQRVKKGLEEWLSVISACTQLGCIPLFNTGNYHDGWLCPCYNFPYDSSGRVRSGPSPKNLIFPQYVFATDAGVRVG